MALRNLTDGKRVSSNSLKAFEELQREAEAILSRYQTEGDARADGGESADPTSTSSEHLSPVDTDTPTDQSAPNSGPVAGSPPNDSTADTSAGEKPESDLDKFTASLEALRSSLREGRSFKTDTPTEATEDTTSTDKLPDEESESPSEIPPLPPLEKLDGDTGSSAVDNSADDGEASSTLERMPAPKADRPPTPPRKYETGANGHGRNKGGAARGEPIQASGSLEDALKAVRDSVGLEPQNGQSTTKAPTPKPTKTKKKRPLSDGIPKSISEDLPKFRGKPRTRICNRCGHETKLRDPVCDKCGRVDESLGILDSVIAGDLAKVEQILLVRPHLITVRTNRHEWTLLHMAASGGNRKMVELLIQKGASVNSTNRDGKTPLHYAAGKGHMNIVQALLEHHADPHARYHNKTAADLAREHGQQEIAAILDRITSKDG